MMIWSHISKLKIAEFKRRQLHLFQQAAKIKCYTYFLGEYTHKITRIVILDPVAKKLIQTRFFYLLILKPD